MPSKSQQRKLRPKLLLLSLLRQGEGEAVLAQIRREGEAVVAHLLNLLLRRVWIARGSWRVLGQSGIGFAQKL